MRISFLDLQQTLKQILSGYGFTDERAMLCARLFAESNRDGYASHGLNRFPLFIRGIERGYIKVDVEPQLFAKTGIIEHWDGRLGPGNLNAYFCMQRAIELADENGIGCVSLKNTNHWLRGGTYGWQSADAGKIGICWTNTKPNLPPWGASASRTGNNPIVMAVPRNKGHIVLDMALSLYSYGKLESYRLANMQLPFEGGYDHNGKLTKDPGQIESSERLLPIGFWKGSGMALMLDLIVTLISGGDATSQIGERDHEFGLSQLFLVFDPQNQAGNKHLEITEKIIDYFKSAKPGEAGDSVYYPGELTLQRREENMRLGVPVDENYWQQILAMQQV